MTLPLRCVFHCLSFFAKDSAFPVCCHCLSSSLRTVPFPRVCTGGGGNLCGHLLRRAQPNLLSKHCCTQSICIPLLKTRGGKVDYEFFCHTHTHTHKHTHTHTHAHTRTHTCFDQHCPWPGGDLSDGAVAAVCGLASGLIEWAAGHAGKTGKA